MAQKLGIPVDQLFPTLAKALPETVDKHSPDGSLKEPKPASGLFGPGQTNANGGPFGAAVASSQMQVGSKKAQLLASWDIGSTGAPPLRISKCSCGEVTLPEAPDLAIVWPRLTFSPGFTSISPLWA